MATSIIEIHTIAEVNALYGYDKPRHPLITVIDYGQVRQVRPAVEVRRRIGFYSIVCKRITGEMRYGMSPYDFSEGTLMFAAPGQVITSGSNLDVQEGWGVFFHPDLLNRTELGRTIHEYHFFSYDVNEALHVSEEENLLLKQCVTQLQLEYERSIDKHTQGLLVSSLALMLQYSERFYERQFITRAKVSHDTVLQFEKLLRQYFTEDRPTLQGLPGVTYFAEKLNLSAGYLTDLLNKYTGKTTQEHIHLELIKQAKSRLWGTGMSIAEIAYELGFEHPSHFTKLFKTKTGVSPRHFRQTN